MINSKDNKEALSARSVIYGALITLALILVIFCVYTVVMVVAAMFKFVAVALGPMIFSIMIAGIVMMVLLGVVQLVKMKRMKDKSEHDNM
jgi:uncharacterized integral membrane protein